MFIILEDGFWNVSPKYKYIDIFNHFNKATILHFWFSLIKFGLWLFLFIYNAMSWSIKFTVMSISCRPLDLKLS